MKALQIILTIIYALSLGVSLGQHGKPKTGTESFWKSLLAAVIVFALLIWGGFFS